MATTILESTSVKEKISIDTLKKAFGLMCTAKSMTELYEANKEVTAKYVHATSRGHEAIQISTGFAIITTRLFKCLLS